MSDMTACRVGALLVAGLSLAAGLAAAAPEPLRVGRVTLDGADVFTDAEVAAVGGAEGTLRRVMNALHVQTHDYVIRRELLFAPGDVYDPEKLAETERNLRRVGYLSTARVAAVDTLADGTVNIAVVTRDAWSLQASFTWSLASGGDQRWSVRLTERNFLGHGFSLGAGVGGDEDRGFWNAFYRQRRVIAGTIGAGLDYSESEDGHYRGAFLERDFLAQDDPWGGRVRVWDSLADPRWYLSNAGPAGADPARGASLYARIPRRERAGEAEALLRLNDRRDRRFWRLGGGARVTDVAYDLDGRSALSDGRPADLDFLRGPDGTLAREEGRKVWAYAALQTEGRRWTKARFVMQYGPTEDLPLSLAADLRLGPAGRRTGSTTAWGEDVWRGELVLSRWWHHHRSWWLLTAAGFAETGSARARQHRANVVGGWVGHAGGTDAPWQGRVFAEVGAGGNLGGVDAFVLGLDRGLRTLDFDGMAGDRLVRWNVEGGKAAPFDLLGLFRVGGAAFYGAGRAWWHDETGGADDLRHEVGCGLRFGPVRTARAQTARLDVSWSLDGAVGPVLTAATGGSF